MLTGNRKIDFTDVMSYYSTPQFSVIEVNNAGRIISSPDIQDITRYFHALDVIENWRSSHAYPLQAFYVTLKRRASKIHKSAFAAQRIKRLESISAKLGREKKMKLSQMQDIGGCRAVVPTIQDVRTLQRSYETSKWSHIPLIPKDYIRCPKPSGYRGVHLKYRYNGKQSAYDNLKIEIQLRTRLQHIWATAVEAADVFTKQALKSSSGSEEWKRFFALVSSVFAHREGQPVVPQTPETLPEIISELKEINRRHHIVSSFAGYRAIMPHVTNKKNAFYFLVSLDLVQRQVSVTGFKRTQSILANTEYTKIEKNKNVKAVLVSVVSIKALQRAYPNYFLDTEAFLREVNKMLI